MSLLTRFLPAQRNEAITTLLMAAYFFLAMASVSILKSVQNALYLGRVGFDLRLPLIYVALAVISGPIVSLFRLLGFRLTQVWLTGLTLGFLALNLVLFAALIERDDPWLYVAFYLWGGVVSVLLPMLGWIAASKLFTTRQAKRLFATLGAGGILGGIAGGYYTAFAAAYSGVELLFHQVAILMAAMMLLMAFVARLHPQSLRKAPSQSPSPESKGARQKLSWGSTLREITHSRYLAALAGLVLVSGLVTTLIDLQYKWMLGNRYPGDETDISEFFGGLLGTAFVLSALVQFLATNPVLRHLGVGTGLLVLPAAVFLGSFGILLASPFWAAVALRGLDGGLRNSIYRTSSELLFVPIASSQSVAVKSLIDLVAYRVGDALAAAVFLTVALMLPDSPRVMGFLVAASAALWILLALQVREGYLRSLRKSMEIRSPRSTRRVLRMGEAVAEKTVLNALNSANPSKVRLALHQLIAVADSDSGEWEAHYSAADDVRVESRVVSILDPAPPRWLPSVEPLERHPDRRVAAAAFSLICRYRREQSIQRLKEALASDQLPSPPYLDYLDQYAASPGHYLDPHRVLRWQEGASTEQGELLARLMGKTRSELFKPLLLKWAQSARSPRSQAAIDALGRYGDPELADFLVSRLGRNWSRLSGRRALIRYGDAIVDRLIALLRQPGCSLEVKREIPLILARINTQESRAGLVAALYLPDVTVSYRALKGLNRIRDFDDLSYNSASFLPILQLWSKQYYELLNMDLALGEASTPALRLLRAAVRERLEWTIEKIFRGLGLFFPVGDAYYSYLGYTSDSRELRANAVELIESRLPGELKKTMLPIFSEGETPEIARIGRRIFGLASELPRILGEALFERDPWLKCCILAAMAELGPRGYEPSVRQALEDIHPRVSETADWVLEAWKSGGAEDARTVPGD